MLTAGHSFHNGGTVTPGGLPVGTVSYLYFLAGCTMNRFGGYALYSGCIAPHIYPLNFDGVTLEVNNDLLVVRMKTESSDVTNLKIFNFFSVVSGVNPTVLVNQVNVGVQYSMAAYGLLSVGGGMAVYGPRFVNPFFDGRNLRVFSGQVTLLVNLALFRAGSSSCIARQYRSKGAGGAFRTDVTGFGDLCAMIRAALGKKDVDYYGIRATTDSAVHVT